MASLIHSRNAARYVGRHTVAPVPGPAPWPCTARLERDRHPVMLQTGISAPPLAWILASDKGGDNAQMRVLAAAAELQVAEFPIEFNKLSDISNLRLGATNRTLTEASCQSLRPPWPDLVISSGGRSVPVARWIRQQSGGRTKLVHVGRPWGRLAWFDLVLAMPQYDLPDRSNVFQARMPFNAHQPAALAEAAQRWRTRFEAYPRPWIGLLVGGKSAPLVLDKATAHDIATKVSRRARQLGGSVLAITSRRTSDEAANALFASLEVPGLKHKWRPADSDSPYLAVLALADELVVTGDSASMLAEAVRAHRPLSIAALPSRPGRRRRRVAMLRRLLLRRIFDFLVDLALVTTTRDVRRLHRRLVGDGLATMLDGAPPPPPQFTDDLEDAARRVRQLLDRKIGPQRLG